MYLKSKLLSGIERVEHGFGTAIEPVPSPFVSDWEAGRRPYWQQVHKDRLAEVSEMGQQLGETDALWTSQPGLLVGVQTADCVPLLFVEKEGRAVAAVHAGWRGTFAEIAVKALTALREHHGHWKVAIGPCIRGDEYEVSPELASDFRSHFSSRLGSEIIVGERNLDLALINQRLLEESGMSRDDIDLIPESTLSAKNVANEYLFHSYRRQPGAGRQWSVVRIKSEH